MIPDKKKNDIGTNKEKSDDDEDLLIDLSKKTKGMKGKGAVFDMKNILGYLNQGENL